ncbi:4Fe-4S binding protein [Anaerophilus nitritogenes]|uniref:4Fe-4S binding protein n=1 Tax=Anaerophilus nitritogenes TaxID=2498136 RepID=UPI00101DCCEF|nr:4Fe-4S binding protein [Anaerophilus nitritogenes]
MMNPFLNIWYRFSFLWLLFFIIGGMFNRYIPLGTAFCMIIPIVLSSIIGSRLWCRKICPRGSFYERIAPISRKRPIPKVFYSRYFRSFIVFLFIILFIKGIIRYWLDFSKIADLFYWMVTITTAIGTFLSFLFYPRTWCVFCPIGSISSLIILFKKWMR